MNMITMSTATATLRTASRVIDLAAHNATKSKTAADETYGTTPQQALERTLQHKHEQGEVWLPRGAKPPRRGRGPHLPPTSEEDFSSCNPPSGLEDRAPQGDLAPVARQARTSPGWQTKGQFSLPHDPAIMGRRSGCYPPVSLERVPSGTAANPSSMRFCLLLALLM